MKVNRHVNWKKQKLKSKAIKEEINMKDIHTSVLTIGYYDPILDFDRTVQVYINKQQLRELLEN